VPNGDLGEDGAAGYTFGRMYSARTGQARLGYRPSKKSIKRVVEHIHALTALEIAALFFSGMIL
jgi:hypothetical protein